MNDRIKELMTQSGIKFKPMVIDGEEYEYRHVEFDDWDAEDEADCLEKFAQLLIDECIQVAMNAKSMEAAALIVMHFGDKNAIE